MIDGHHLGADVAPAPPQDRAALRAAGRGKRQLHFQAGRVLDDVGVGDDVAVGVEDHAGAAAALERRLARRRLILLVGRHVPGHEDLHDARADPLDQLLERARELAEAGEAADGRRRRGRGLGSAIGAANSVTAAQRAAIRQPHATRMFMSCLIRTRPT